MNNLYRLVKACGFCFRAFGVVGGVRLNEPNMLERVAGRMPPGWVKCRPGPVDKLYSLFFNHAVENQKLRRFHVLYGNSQILARSENEEELLEEFERQVSTYVFETCRSKCFVHAGGAYPVRPVQWPGLLGCKCVAKQRCRFEESENPVSAVPPNEGARVRTFAAPVLSWIVKGP